LSIYEEAAVPVCAAPAQPTHTLGSTTFTTLAAPSKGSTEASVWRVEIAAGTPPSPHEVTREEIFVVLSGTASVTLDGTRADVDAGGAIVVPPDTTFSLTAAGSDPLVALCYFPVGGEARMPDGQSFTPPWAQ
jgi:quercetin dioxygenase-like cupin family protein